jgi:hypothetical protein
MDWMDKIILQLGTKPPKHTCKLVLPLEGVEKPLLCTQMLHQTILTLLHTIHSSLILLTHTTSESTKKNERESSKALNCPLRRSRHPNPPLILATTIAALISPGIRVADQVAEHFGRVFQYRSVFPGTVWCKNDCRSKFFASYIFLHLPFTLATM